MEFILSIVINTAQKSPRNTSSQTVPQHVLVLQLDGAADHVEKPNYLNYLMTTSCHLHSGNSQRLKSQKTTQQNQVK